MKMKTILKSVVISCILLCLLVSLTPITMAVNPSYIIHGQITAKDGSHPNDVIVTVTNVNQNNETLTRATYTDASNNEGTYQVDLGNMANWSRNDTILVSASYKSYVGSGTFIIPASGTIYEVSFNLTTKEHAGPGKSEGYNLIPAALGSFVGVFIIIIFAIALFIIFLSRKKQ
jgi:hypothetical protein